MNKLFRIGKITNKLMYPLLMGFFSFLSLISYKGLRKVYYYNGYQEKKYFYQKPFLVAWVMSLSEIASVFFFAIQKNRSRRKRNIDKDNEMTQYNNNLIEKNTLGKNVLEIFPGDNKWLLLLKIVPICILELCIYYCSLNIKRRKQFLL